VQYCHSKQRYEIEVPVDLVSGSKKPRCFDLTSKRTGFERFMTHDLALKIERLEQAEDDLKEAITPFVYALFTRFLDSRHLWQPAVAVLAELDCLASLAVASNNQDEPMCRPQFLKYEDKYKKRPYLELKSMRHPCASLGKKFVPNDTVIDKASVLLVTGPNMGGKSTLLRQTCLGVILAQMGCFVPAESCILTPVDRIFTRIGASDRILEGKSTFFVEMEETNNILKSATFKSLAIVDELGRGTSTFDGFSIACAVLHHLVTVLKCRALFSTHYHMLLA
jgi:DNA mismatch repair protein MSH6